MSSLCAARHLQIDDELLAVQVKRTKQLEQVVRPTRARLCDIREFTKP